MRWYLPIDHSSWGVLPFLPRVCSTLEGGCCGLLEEHVRVLKYITVIEMFLFLPQYRTQGDSLPVGGLREDPCSGRTGGLWTVNPSSVFTSLS